MNESEIPIDIHSGKLQEWLVSRRIVPKSIQPYIKDIRGKISNALVDMPGNDELIQLLSGEYINYFHCKDIIEILKQTEKDTKSVFGTYGSQRMKDWLEILKLYEKENIYIAEAAQIFVRNLTFEIPNIKKQMTRLEQQSEESLKKVYELEKTEHILLNEHTLLCQQLGIKGKHLKKELTDKIKELPKIYSGSICDIKNITESVKMYAEFSKNCNCLPLVRHVIEFGNTTVYQFVNKEPPLKIQENEINLNIEESIHDQIDYGKTHSANDSNFIKIDYGNAANPTDELIIEYENTNWGDSIEPSPSDKVEIDFDVPLEDYGIIVEESQDTSMYKGLAKGDQAYTILDSPHYREKFIDELYELESFLKLRHYEINQLDTCGNLMFSLMGNMSSHDLKSVRTLLEALEKIIISVESEQTQHLFQLKHSAKYTDILVGKFKQKLVAAEKIKATQGLLKVKAVQLKKQKDDLKPLLNNLISKTKILQSQIEKDISKRYKNRPVNLMSGISAI